jgi:hypothetical protein
MKTRSSFAPALIGGRIRASLAVVAALLAAPQPARAQATSGDVCVGATLASGLDMGVNTSGGRTDWVAKRQGFMECVYPAGQQWGAVFITVGPPTSDVSGRGTRDYSAYDSLSLELKGAAGGERVSIGVKTAADPDDGMEPKYVVSDLARDWRTVTIPLSSLVRPPVYPGARHSRLYVVFEIVFEPGTPAETVSFRNVRFLRSAKPAHRALSFMPLISVPALRVGEGAG